MRILLVGAGGVGAAFAAIAARRDFFETVVVADYNAASAEKAAAADPRFTAAQIDASSADSVAALCRDHAITHVIECAEQLRGTAGRRQIPKAEIGVVTAGGGTMAGTLLLSADR